MDLLKRTQELCRIYNIKPARSKGQNFLIKEEIYDQIVVAAELKPEDVVLEVGPGLGFLTAKLAKAAGRVIAVELDDKLAEVLYIGLKTQRIENVEIINQDILQLEIENWKLKIGNFNIVANLPYNITSVFLRKILSSEIKPKMMVLMLQKEVAERICAVPGEMSLLAVSVQFYARPEIVGYVSKENFWPEPEVDSAIAKLKVKSEKLSPRDGIPFAGKVNEREFFRLVKIGFSAKRKMLKNNLAAGLRIDQKVIAEKLKTAGFSQNVRAQELSVEDWLKLFAQFQ